MRSYASVEAVEAALLLGAPMSAKAPIHTQHMGQHGDDALIDLLPSSRAGGSRRATTALLG